MDVIFLKKFAAEQDVSELRAWLISLANNGKLERNVNSPLRGFRYLGELSQVAPAIDRLDLSLQRHFGIEGKCVNLRDFDAANRLKATPSFIGLQINGGFVQPHVDINIGEMVQFRCTLLINKPQSGGNLVLSGKEYQMDIGDFYCFISNSTIHGTTEIVGPVARMSCSFGYLVDRSFSLDRFSNDPPGKV